MRILSDDDDGDVRDWTVAAGLAADPDSPYNVGADVFEALFDSDTRVTRTAEMLQALCSRLSAENFQYRIAAAEADNTLAYAARQGVGAAIMTVDSDLIFLGRLLLPSYLFIHLYVYSFIFFIS